jgi:hypothetical protein
MPTEDKPDVTPDVTPLDVARLIAELDEARRTIATLKSTMSNLTGAAASLRRIFEQAPNLMDAQMVADLLLANRDVLAQLPETNGKPSRKMRRDWVSR